MKVGNGRRGNVKFTGKSSTEEVNEKSKYQGGRRIHSYEEAEKREFNEYYDSKESDEDFESNDKNKYIDYLEGGIEGETESERIARLQRLYQARRDAEKESKIKKRTGKLGMTGGKLAGIIFTGLLSSCLMCGCVYLGYMKYIKYPSEMSVDVEKTGMYALDEWVDAIRCFDGSAGNYLGGMSYLDLERDYANGNQDRLDFFERVIDSVEYTPDVVVAKNRYGNTMVNSSDEIVYRDSYVDVGEELTLTYVDYDKIQFNSDVVKSMMEEEGLKLGDPGYSSKLTNLFCRYMGRIDELPVKKVRYTPNLYKVKGDSYRVVENEDIYLDKLLFSSDSFYNMLERFSLISGANSVNPEWTVWDALTDREKEKKQEPIKVLSELPISDEWVNWKKEGKEDTDGIEPDKYPIDYVIGKTWCGAYYLQNEYTEVDASGNVVRRVVKAPLGDGSFENPASVGTEVLSVVRGNVKDGDKIVSKEYPISVTMVEYGVSEDAINWFESKDERNRGKDLLSEVQYVYYVFEVKNLSDKTIKISDNSSLSDANVNLTKRTGTVYGLVDSVVLKPGESGRVESWSCGVDLNKKYIIWGADFKRESDVVWFRKLAGDLEDTSENKGVSINRSRYRDEDTESMYDLYEE